MKRVLDYDEEWNAKTPFEVPDGHGGAIVVLETVTVCPDCGALADQRMSYVFEGTKSPSLLELRMGASVKHYFTQCRANSYHGWVS